MKSSAKKFSSVEVAKLLWKKYAERDQFFCGSDEYVLCFSD